MSSFQQWCGFTGAILIPIGCIVVSFVTLRRINQIGFCICAIPSKKSIRMVFAIIASEVFPISCFFRKWDPWFAVALCLLGVGYAWYLLTSLLLLRKNGIYENGIILENTCVHRDSINSVSIDQNGSILITKSDMTVVTALIPALLDITNVPEWIQLNDL